MTNEGSDSVIDLTHVLGGFDAGKCFDDVWPWAAGGAVAGAYGGPWSAGLGALGGGAAGALTSVNCGSNGQSPATMLRESVTSGFNSDSSSSFDPSATVFP